MPLTAAQLNAVLDAIAEGAIALQGAQAGLASSQTDLVAAALALADLNSIASIAQSVTSIGNQSALSVQCSALYADIVSRLGTLAGSQGLGVGTLDAWLGYFNTGAGGPFAALQHPAVRYILSGLNIAPNLYNFYFPVTGADHVGKVSAAGAFVAGTVTVDQTKYCGGRGSVICNTHAAAQGDVTVTGTVYDPASKSFLAGKTMVTTAGGFAAVGIENYLSPGGATPAPANSLLVAVSAIAGVAAGNDLSTHLHAPAGRLQEAKWLN